jgi:hypothetical protein
MDRPALLQSLPGDPAVMLALTVVAVLASAAVFRDARSRCACTDDHAFAWSFAVGLCCLLGVAPGLVALGLFGTVEREMSPTLLVVAALAAAAVVIAFSTVVTVDVGSGF